MKQIVIEKFQYWSLTFHNLLPNLMERAEGIKITYMCDNAREGVKIQIKKKGKTWEPVLQRAHIFRARPTHLARHHATKLERVYQLARSCTQERS